VNQFLDGTLLQQVNIPINSPFILAVAIILDIGLQRIEKDSEPGKTEIYRSNEMKRGWTKSSSGRWCLNLEHVHLWQGQGGAC
jgi:hypothetical protein